MKSDGELPWKEILSGKHEMEVPPVTETPIGGPDFFSYIFF
jgi:hypothetical protein